MCFDPTIGYYNHWQGQNHQANLQIVKFQTFGIGFSDSLPLTHSFQRGRKTLFMRRVLAILALMCVDITIFAMVKKKSSNNVGHYR